MFTLCLQDAEFGEAGKTNEIKEKRVYRRGLEKDVCDNRPYTLKYHKCGKFCARGDSLD